MTILSPSNEFLQIKPHLIISFDCFMLSMEMTLRRSFALKIITLHSHYQRYFSSFFQSKLTQNSMMIWVFIFFIKEFQSQFLKLCLKSLMLLWSLSKISALFILSTILQSTKDSFKSSNFWKKPLENISKQLLKSMLVSVSLLFRLKKILTWNLM